MHTLISKNSHLTSLLTHPAHMSTFFMGSLTQNTVASISSICGSSYIVAYFANRLCWLFRCFDFANMDSGTRKHGQRVTLTPFRVTNWIQSLICVSTLLFAPVSGTPSNRICRSLLRRFVSIYITIGHVDDTCSISIPIICYFYVRRMLHFYFW